MTHVRNALCSPEEQVPLSAEEPATLWRNFFPRIFYSHHAEPSRTVRCLSGMVRVVEAAGKLQSHSPLINSAGDYSHLLDFVCLQQIAWVCFEYLGLDQLWDLPSPLSWSFPSRVKPHLSHLSHSGCWCRRLLPSFPGYGAEPAGWQHRFITVRRFSTRDVHHSCLHCLHHGQTNSEHCQTGEG